MLKIVFISCMSVSMSAPPLLGLPHFPCLPHHPNSLLPLVAFREYPLHGTECVQAHPHAIFDVHTQFETMALILKIALRKHEPSKETSVFDQTCVEREEAARRHREVAPQYRKHAGKNSPAFASSMGV
jgi:hypothetical protein